MSTHNSHPTIRRTEGEAPQGAAPQWSGPAGPTPPVSRPVDHTFVQGQSGYGSGSVGAGETQIIRGKVKPTFAYLIVRDGFRSGQVFSLHPKATTVGRDGGNDIAIDDQAISGQHLKIRTEKDEDGKLQFILHDLASANGTRVNGEDALRHPLADGDEVEIGETHLVFKQI